MSRRWDKKRTADHRQNAYGEIGLYIGLLSEAMEIPDKEFRLGL